MNGNITHEALLAAGPLILKVLMPGFAFIGALNPSMQGGSLFSVEHALWEVMCGILEYGFLRIDAQQRECGYTFRTDSCGVSKPAVFNGNPQELCEHSLAVADCSTHAEHSAARGLRPLLLNGEAG